MKKINTFLCTFAVSIIALSATTQVYCWTIPPSFDVYDVKFLSSIDVLINHGSEQTDGKQRRFAYKLSTSPTVQACFDWTGTADFDSVLINTQKYMGDPDWTLDDTKVEKPATGTCTDYETFGHDYTLPSSVDKSFIAWYWYIVEVNGSAVTPIHVGTSSHNYYTLIDDPEEPMDELYEGGPWSEVLDKACYWADGETTKSGAATEITKGLYDSFGDQDGDIDYDWPDGDIKYSSNTSPYSTFHLSTFLDSLTIKSDVLVNCTDMANLVAIYTASVGCESGTKILDGTGSTNYIYLIGDNPGEWVRPTDPTWDYHHYGWYNDKIFDAVLKVNQGSPLYPANMTQYTYNTYLGYSYSDSTEVSRVYLGN